MKAQRRLGLALSWPRLTTVFVVDILILLLASHCPKAWQGEHRVAWWVGVGLAVLVALLALVTYRGITVASGLATWVWDWSADPGTALAAGCTPAIDHQRRFGRDTVGVREYQGRLVTVIAVGGSGEEAAGRHRHRTSSASGSSMDALPVDAVADGLRQFDIHLDSIDIVSLKVRQGGNAAELSKLDDWGPEEWEELNDRPRSYQHSTWLVLRMDPQRNVAAVAVRDSLASTLVAATERLAQDLDGQSCAARPLTADELAEVDSAVLADLEPTWSRPGWRHLKHFNGYTTSFWVTPSDINAETLDELWQADTEATVITIRLTSRGGRPQVSAWVRYHTEGKLPRKLSAGLNRLTGRQLAAVRASLPTPSLRARLALPSRGLYDHDELMFELGQPQESSTSLPAGR
ncbi:type VII secretion protein EccE [Mycobacterium sp. 852002-51163_SCH5372311]|uniref:type VII secretion protein EccE n=1 Tax=Mycobacterium sp. 852002-51163_SCH5372311 TaxID=1834097 RepID=UPI0007FD2E9B|nr:type VII secretion protein EccE [Mycobacterium sp. 852002-51163_SCH5372311]OBF89505.1 type VII secretion protein EccE [Mycobacterium sp. 852002-51163_SCH5372311]